MNKNQNLFNEESANYIWKYILKKKKEKKNERKKGNWVNIN